MEYVTVQTSEYGERENLTDEEFFEWILITEMLHERLEVKNQKSRDN